VTNEVVDAVSKEGDKAGVAIDDAGITTKIKPPSLLSLG
jgi:hypothetical protein